MILLHQEIEDNCYSLSSIRIKFLCILILLLSWMSLYSKSFAENEFLLSPCSEVYSYVFLTLSGLCCVLYSYNKLRRLSMKDKMERRRFLWILFFIVILLFGIMLVLCSSYRINALKCINDILTELARKMLGKERLETYILLCQSEDSIDYSAFTIALFSIGMLVLSLSHNRHHSHLNPYTLQEYFSVLLFICALLSIVLTIAFCIVMKLYALLITLMFIHISLCIGLPTYFFILHTPEHIAYKMAEVLYKKVALWQRESQVRVHQNIFSYTMDTKDIFDIHSQRLKNILMDMTVWKTQLFQKSAEDGMIYSMYSHTMYYAQSFMHLFHLISEHDEREDEKKRLMALVFCMGLWMGMHVMDCDKLKEDRYFRLMLNHFKTALERESGFTGQLLRQFIGGMIGARLTDAYLEQFPKDTYSIQEISELKRSEMMRPCDKAVEQCIDDCSAALGKDWRLWVGLKPGNPKQPGLSHEYNPVGMWCYCIIIGQDANIPTLSQAFGKIEIAYLYDKALACVNQCFYYINGIWSLYRAYHCDGLRELTQDSVKNNLMEARRLEQRDVNEGSLSRITAEKTDEVLQHYQPQEDL